MKIFYNLVWSLLLLILSCNNAEKKISPAFYYWKTTFDLNKEEQEKLKQLNVKKLYVRCFDVDRKSEKADHEAVGSLVVNSFFPDSIEFIPTIFLTNRSLLNISDLALSQLVENIHFKVHEIAQKLDVENFNELQLDCDWTNKTRAAFFELLQKLKVSFGQKIILSSTIRLHQIKFSEKTGVPPVDKGMLMYYNMSDIDDVRTENSILDNKIGSLYLNKLEKYPLPIDIALPIFSWGVVFRENQFLKLINHLNPSNLSGDNRFQKIDATHFEIQKNTYVNGIYLYENDIIRVEQSNFEDIIQAKQLLKKAQPTTIALYHFDDQNFQHYSLKNFQQIFKN